MVRLLALSIAVGLGAGCAIIAPAVDTLRPNQGAGGATTNFDASLTTGAGPAGPDSGPSGNGGGIDIGPNDAGTDATLATPLTSYEYLCGGSSATCLPGTATDLCAPGGNPGIGGSPPNASTYSCQLVAADGGGVSAQCRNAGASGDGDPCTEASDCSAELGCISTGVTPICRPYCCDGLETCPMDTYCVAQPMANATQNQIPVCVPAQSCILLESGCGPGGACQIVRESGTTSCVTPGAGTAGSACPCAAGFTCSWAEGTCVKLCTPSTQGTDCLANQYCQTGVQPYPLGYGYCVSY
jgi:hypothetical protein